VAGAATGDALTELLGLNISLSENFGDAVGLAAGLAAASVFAFLRARFASGETAGLVGKCNVGCDEPGYSFEFVLTNQTVSNKRRRWNREPPQVSTANAFVELHKFLLIDECSPHGCEGHKKHKNVLAELEPHEVA